MRGSCGRLIWHIWRVAQIYCIQGNGKTDVTPIDESQIVKDLLGPIEAAIRSFFFVIIKCMKKITCIDCDQQFGGETREGVMQAMMPHYMSDHKDVMAQANEEKKKVWFAELDKRWNEAEEV